MISIHAPLCGGRRDLVDDEPEDAEFQSTPPCAGGDPKNNNIGG